MKRIPNSLSPDKVILVHNGAMGDFLLFWPCALTARQAWPEARMVWAGPPSYSHWLAPLGFEPCTAALRKGLDRLFISGGPAEEGVLGDWLILWPVLTTLPGISPSANCCFLQGIVKGSAMSPRERYLAGLERLGVPPKVAWREAFRGYFARNRHPGDRILLFPGSGHPLKQWPLVQFIELARGITALGLRPLFVAGPAEQERGLVPPAQEWIAPQDLPELQDLLLTARAVVGGDTGPMHLAGMLGVPGVSLFGPTGFSQWGPQGMREASLGLPCSPCTADCSDLVCDNPRCMEELPVERVMKVLREVLNAKTGFQGPGIP